MQRSPAFRLSPALLGLGCALALGSTTLAQQGGSSSPGTSTSTNTSTGAGTAPTPTAPSTPGGAAPVTSPAVICGLVGQGAGGSGTTGSATGGTSGSGGASGTRGTGTGGTVGTGSGTGTTPGTASTGTGGASGTTGTASTGTQGGAGSGSTGGTTGTATGSASGASGTSGTSGSTSTGSTGSGSASASTGTGSTASTGSTSGTTGTSTSGAAGSTSSGGTSTGGTSGAATGNNTSGARLSSTDTCFAQQAALSDLFEIQSSQLAGAQANNAQVKAYTQQMIRDHTATSRQLGSLAPRLGLRLPTALEGPKLTEVAALRNQRGVAFDRAYVTAQVNSHEQAVNLFRLYGELGGANPQLKAHAARYLPALRQHLESARNLLTRLAQ